MTRIDKDFFPRRKAFKYPRTSSHCRSKSLCIDIWDSPGLGFSDDDDVCIEEMKALGDNADLILFCINMNDIRFQQTHMDAIGNLSNGLGRKIWSKTIIVMTFVNLVVDRLVEMDGSYYSFNQYLGEWRSRLVQNIRANGVGQDIALCIPVVPVGYDMKCALAGHDNWMEALWCTCICRMREQLQAKGLLYMYCIKNLIICCSNRGWKSRVLCVMCSCARPDNYVVPTEETHVQSDDQSGEKQLGDGK